MYYASKTFHFCAAHRLLNYKGPCANLHGHNYKVEVVLKSATLHEDMVCDFGEYTFYNFGCFVDQYLDHKILVSAEDTVLLSCAEAHSMRYFAMGHRTTAENLARVLCGHVKPGRPEVTVARVTVWETEKCYATYVPD